MTDPSTFAQGSSSLLDFSDSIGSFIILSQKGQLFALNRILISRDFSKLAPQIAGANFHVIYPLVARVKPSNIVLVIHPGERAQAYFLMDIKAGPLKKTIKVFQETVEIITSALDDDAFPIIHLGEMQKAALVSRKNQTPLSIPIRFLELRRTLPEGWSAAVKDIFLANTEPSRDKTKPLEEKLQRLRQAIRNTMYESFLTKCMWFDAEGGYLGRVEFDGASVIFKPFGPGDAQTTSFIQSLARTPDGRFEMRQEFANVIPTLLKQHPWSSPTLHIYDENFRTKNKLEEYYSLYKGLKALCAIGAPVLLYRGEDTEASIPVTLLRPSMRGGDITQLSVKEFPAREVVWAETEF